MTEVTKIHQWMGTPVTELERFELLHVIDHLAEEVERMRNEIERMRPHVNYASYLL